MKKFICTLCVALAAAVAVLPLVGCGGGKKGPGNITVDKSKTQLYIGNYDGGMGSRWLEEYVAAFEEKYKDAKLEEGKTGVQIIPVSDKDMFDGAQVENSMANSNVNLFFTERMSYYKMVKENRLYDISDAVTEVLEGEEKSIEGKMTQSQQNYYKVDGKYYGVPHYQTYRGITYDIDLFNQRRLYLVQNGSSVAVGGRQGDADLTAGPNGEPGDYDDGLPATYSEFFYWCSQVSDIVYPLIWTGAHKEAYTEHLLEALFCTAQGYEEANYRYNLVTDENTAETSRLVTGFNGDVPVVAEQPLTGRALLTKQVGLYNALDFLGRVVQGNYYYPDSLNLLESHEMVHYHFLNSRFDGSKPIAMMVEGTWWEEESTSLFAEMEAKYDGASRKERKFGFLPLPKPDGNALGGPVLFDGNQAIAVVNATSSEVQANLAMEFLRFISSDYNLQRFNMITGVGRDYIFKLESDQEAELSAFAKSIYDVRQDAEGIVYGYAQSMATYNWVSVNKIDVYSSYYDSGTTASPIGGLTSGVSAKKFFEGIYANATR